MRVLLRDRYGNAVAADDTNGVALTLHGASRVCGEVTLEESHTLSGVLHASAIATVSGRYYAHVTLDGEQVGGSPFALSVRAAAAVGGACEVWGDALGGTLVAGGRARFALRMRDEYGNVSAGHAGLLTATITPPLAPPTPAGDDDDAPASVSVAQAAVCELGEEEEGAVVSGHVSASMAGEHTLRLALAGEPLPRAPFALTVCPAPAHAPSCELSQPPHGIAAGELVRLRVVARDRYGNLQVEGGDFHLWVKGPQRALEQEVRHLGNGEYELRARLPLSGEYELHVTLHKAHVRGSPIAILVHPSSPGGTPLPPPPAPTPVPVAGTPPTARSPVRSPPVRSPPVRSPARPSAAATAVPSARELAVRPGGARPLGRTAGGRTSAAVVVPPPVPSLQPPRTPRSAGGGPSGGPSSWTDPSSWSHGAAGAGDVSGRADAVPEPTCTAQGSGLQRAEAGSEARFEVTKADGRGTPRPISAAALSVDSAAARRGRRRLGNPRCA